MVCRKRQVQIWADCRLKQRSSYWKLQNGGMKIWESVLLIGKKAWFGRFCIETKFWADSKATKRVSERGGLSDKRRNLLARVVEQKIWKLCCTNDQHTRYSNLSRWVFHGKFVKILDDELTKICSIPRRISNIIYHRFMAVNNSCRKIGWVRHILIYRVFKKI